MSRPAIDDAILRVEVSPELKRAMSARAAIEDRTLSAQVRVALLEHLASPARPLRARARGKPERK